jgi:nitrile hydratase accessory protein
MIMPSDSTNSKGEIVVPIEVLRRVPHDEEGPIFRAPWEAQSFAMAVALHALGYFAWSEWTETLSRTIHDAQEAGDMDLGDTYYEHWLNALEEIVSQKELVTRSSLASRREQWRLAASLTPHGHPILLETAERARDGR